MASAQQIATTLTARHCPVCGTLLTAIVLQNEVFYNYLYQRTVKHCEDLSLTYTHHSFMSTYRSLSIQQKELIKRYHYQEP